MRADPPGSAAQVRRLRLLAWSTVLAPPALFIPWAILAVVEVPFFADNAFGAVVLALVWPVDILIMRHHLRPARAAPAGAP